MRNPRQLIDTQYYFQAKLWVAISLTHFLQSIQAKNAQLFAVNGEHAFVFLEAGEQSADVNAVTEVPLRRSGGQLQQALHS